MGKHGGGGGGHGGGGGGGGIFTNPRPWNSPGGAPGTTFDKNGNVIPAVTKTGSVSGDGARVGGGFQGLVDGNTPGTPPRFSGGGDMGGGGGSGGNPLTAGSTDAALKEQDIESILHGAKKRGRVRAERGTE